MKFSLLSIVLAVVLTAGLFGLFFLYATASTERRRTLFWLGMLFLLVTAVQVAILFLAPAHS